jgi:hypothetical protein
LDRFEPGRKRLSPSRGAALRRERLTRNAKQPWSCVDRHLVETSPGNQERLSDYILNQIRLGTPADVERDIPIVTSKQALQPRLSVPPAHRR